MPTNRERVIQYGADQTYVGEPASYQGMGETTEPGCGDVMRFYISTRREIITEISYTITESACWPVKACAAYTASIAKDKPVMEAYLINREQISEFFGGLDKEHVHCAIMAELTLKRAIIDYVKKRNEAIAAQNEQK